MKCGIGIALMDAAGFTEGQRVSVRCIDGALHDGELAELVFLPVFGLNNLVFGHPGTARNLRG